MGYVHDGRCLPIETFQHTQVAVPTAGGVPGGPDDVVLSWRVERATPYGPLSARGRLTDGTPIAIADSRTTYGNELGSAIGFVQINDPNFMAGGFDASRRAMGLGVDYTFNWFYVDGEHIGYQHSCACPLRDPRVDPYLPVWGDGRYDHIGRLPFDGQPWAVDPAEGYITSWNNRQAPGFGANDREFSYGPVYRSLSLDRRIEARLGSGGPVSRAEVVDVMVDAATVDVHGAETLPELLAVLGPKAPTPSILALRYCATGWPRGWRRAPIGGTVTATAPTTIRLGRRPWTRGGPGCSTPCSPRRPARRSPPSRSASRTRPRPTTGRHSTAAPPAMSTRTSVSCSAKRWSTRGTARTAGGDLDACRAALWASLARAATDLQGAFGSSNPDAWRRAVADDQIEFRQLVVGAPPMPWQNPPTFQQVVQLPTHAGVVSAQSTSATGARVLGHRLLAATGSDAGAGLVALLVGLTLVARAATRRSQAGLPTSPTRTRRRRRYSRARGPSGPPP